MKTLLLLVLLAAPAPAQKAAPSSKQQKIDKVLALTGARQAGERMLEMVRKQMTPEQSKQFEKNFDMDLLMSRIAAVYDRHFSEQDLDGMLAFYQSSAGKKMLQELPAVSQESVQVGQQYALELLQKMRAAQQPADVPGK